VRALPQEVSASASLRQAEQVQAPAWVRSAGPEERQVQQVQPMMLALATSAVLLVLLAWA
jgi:hypothetical protein